MKTVDEVKKTIDELIEKNTQDNGKNLPRSPRQPADEKNERRMNRDRKQLEFLRGIKIYLESNPTKEFVGSEHKRVSGWIATVKERWIERNAKHENKLSNEVRDEFYKEHDLPKFKKQLKTLTYILS
jgi:hypothetical protein